MSDYDSKFTVIQVKIRDKDMNDDANCVSGSTINDEDLSSGKKGSKIKRKIQPPSSLKLIVRKTCEIKRSAQHELCSFDMLLDSPSAPVSTVFIYLTQNKTTDNQELLERNKANITTASVGLTAAFLGGILYKPKTKNKIDYCHLRSYSWLK